MKKLFAIILLLCCTSTVIIYAQSELYGFKPLGNDLVWQYVYETDLSPTEIKEYFISSGKFESVQGNDSSIWGNSKKKQLNRKSAGVGRGTLSRAYALLNYPLSYFIKIDIKDGKYRVTVGNITAHPDISLSYMGVSTNTNTQISARELLYNFNKGKFKNKEGCAGISLCLYDEFLIDKKILDKTDDNW